MTFTDFEINQLSKQNKNCLIDEHNNGLCMYLMVIINIIEVEITIVKITIFDVWCSLIKLKYLTIV